MDQSKAKEIVEANLPSLTKAFGVDRWQISIKFGPCTNPKLVGSCENSLPYNSATIEIDPHKTEDEADLLDTLRHELCHIVLAPFDLYRARYLHTVEERSVQANQEGSIWEWAIEQAVIGLQRMWAGALEYSKPDAAEPPKE